MIPDSLREYVYYEEPNIVLLKGDCLDMLPHFEPNSVDLVLTDPPYGVNLDYEQFDDNNKSMRDLIKSVMPLLIKLSARVALTCGVPNIWAYPESDWILSWNIPAASSSGKWGFIDWSPILVYGKDPYLQTGKGRQSTVIIKQENSPKNGHPCPKPVDFWGMLLKRCSVSDTDIILDPFLGSGTTAVACKQLGRKCIGIELEAKYLDVAIERLRQEQLF
jgi:DNA modification methylase